MKFNKTELFGVYLIKPRVFEDNRGFFYESFNQKEFNSFFPNVSFVQDNHSHSIKGVLRGLHYQFEKPQGKLVRVLNGSVLDVVLDLRKSSPTFGKIYSVHLDHIEKNQLWIPEGCAHGFYTLSKTADFSYKTTNYYNPETERTIAWDDPDLSIDWKLSIDRPLISDKDKNNGIPFRKAEYFN